MNSTLRQKVRYNTLRPNPANAKYNLCVVQFKVRLLPNLISSWMSTLLIGLSVIVRRCRARRMVAPTRVPTATESTRSRSRTA